MHKKFLKLNCVICAAALAAVFSACGQTAGELYVRRTYAFFNEADAQWVFEKQSDETEAETWNRITEVLSRVEQSVSVGEEGSAISAFNAAPAGTEVQLDETAYRVLTVAKAVYEKTDGAYNPAVGNLIDLWGFSPRFSAHYTPQFPFDRQDPAKELPSAEYIEAFLTLCDFSQVELSVRDGNYYALKPDCEATVGGVTYNMQLNLGGIGKGYAVDEADKIIRAAGYEYGYFNLGYSSMSTLKKPGESHWEIGVNNPRGTEICSGSNYMSVNEADVCLSTSGDNVQYYLLGGKRYCHIINPGTGYPVNAAPGEEGGIIFASVFGLSAAEGDATTTALIVMGKDKAVEYIRGNLAGVRVCFLYDNGSGYTLYTNMNAENYTLYADLETVKI